MIAQRSDGATNGGPGHNIHVSINIVDSGFESNGGTNNRASRSERGEGLGSGEENRKKLERFDKETDHRACHERTKMCWLVVAEFPHGMLSKNGEPIDRAEVEKQLFKALGKHSKRSLIIKQADNGSQISWQDGPAGDGGPDFTTRLSRMPPDDDPGAVG